jgi:hypothetical protein
MRRRHERLDHGPGSGGASGGGGGQLAERSGLVTNGPCGGQPAVARVMMA